MKNLVLLTQSVWPGLYPGQPTAICIDADTETIWGITDGDVLVGWEKNTVIAEIDLMIVAELQETSACTDMHYIAEQQAVSIAFNTGELVLYHTTTQETEVVGCVESGLKAQAWSPDLEILLLLTGAGTFILMTKDFDVVTEREIQTENFGEQKFINVGWGKKETQFHGSAGKEAAVAKEERKSTVLYDDHKYRASWRGDGQYFVVSSIDKEGDPRKLRVYTREGVLDSTSEWVAGLEHAVDWKPSGSLIASTERLPHRHDIVFLERNGLRHGEFTLPVKQNEVYVRELLWNCDSTVLAVWLQGLEPGSGSCLQLWTSNNYHWYLKQEYKYSQEDQICSATWHPENPDRIVVGTNSGTLCQCTLTTDVYTSNDCSDPANPSNVGVIDGQSLLLTPFRYANVPPPMSLHTLKMDTSIQSVVFGKYIAVLLAGNLLSLYRQDNPRSMPVPIAEEISLVDGGDSSLSLVRHMQWCGPSTLLAVRMDVDKQVDVLWKYTLDVTESSAVIVAKSQSVMESQVLRMHGDPSRGVGCVQLVDGSLIKCVIGEPEESPSLQPWDTSDEAPSPCNWMKTVQAEGVDLAFCLSSKYRLYVNHCQLADDCTSFAIHDQHITYLTLGHMACFITFHDILRIITGAATVTKMTGQLERKVERGSHIVVAVKQDVKMVLQMPRGNLETVCPRVFVLEDVRRNLDAKQWLSAFLQARKHRLDMNILYDHNPTIFEENVAGFLQALANVKYINLFLSDLKDVDVAKKLYGVIDMATAEKGLEEVLVLGKIDRICKLIRSHLMQQHLDDSNNEYLLSVIMTYALETSDNALEHALEYVKKLKDTESGSEEVSADEALTFLCFLADVDRLYDAALGMYDFDLVLMVAEKSQKDPKEYIPFLERLTVLPTYLQRHEIDKYLNRGSKALRNLSLAGPEHTDACMTYMKEKELFKDGLSIFANNSEALKAVQLLYGDYLMTTKKKYQDASLMYELGGHLEKAMAASHRAGTWQQTFCLANQMGYDARQLAVLAQEVCSDLLTRSNYVDAARVFQDYAQDDEEAIAALVHGQQWIEAFRLIHKARRLDLIETNLLPGLLNSWEKEVGSLEETIARFTKQRDRLLVVREIKAKRAQMMLDGFMDDMGDVGDADLFSDTSSIASWRSGSSRGSRGSSRSNSSRSSTRSKKKNDKKKRSLREGGPYEEEALMDHMGETTVQLAAMGECVRAMLQMLSRFKKNQKAVRLQEVYSRALQLVEASHSIVWVPVVKIDPDQDQTNEMPEVESAPAPPALSKDAMTRWMLNYI